MKVRVPVLAFLVLLLALASAYAQLRGHGGPVRALAISPDGTQAVSGSFDTSVIRWSLQNDAAEQVNLNMHRKWVKHPNLRLIASSPPGASARRCAAPARPAAPAPPAATPQRRRAA